MDEHIISLCNEISLIFDIMMLGYYSIYSPTSDLQIKNRQIKVRSTNLSFYIYPTYMSCYAGDGKHYRIILRDEIYITIPGYSQQETIRLLTKILTRLQSRFYVN